MTAPSHRTGAAGAVALAATHTWFERHSGWAPPDPATLSDWAAEDACRAPDDCWVPRRGICSHGLVSWQVVLDALAVEDGAGEVGRRPGTAREGTLP